jgi:hypothetical protein
LSTSAAKLRLFFATVRFRHRQARCRERVRRGAHGSGRQATCQECPSKRPRPRRSPCNGCGRHRARAVEHGLGERADPARIVADDEMFELPHGGFDGADEAVERALAEPGETGIVCRPTKSQFFQPAPTVKVLMRVIFIAPIPVGLQGRRRSGWRCRDRSASARSARRRIR